MGVTSFATDQADGYVEVDGLIIGKGGTRATGIDVDRIPVVAKVALGVGTSGGGVFSWQNPESVSVLILRILLDITTQSSGASTIDVGTTAVNATTSSDNLIDGVSGATAALIDNTLAATLGTNGKPSQKLAAGKWVTASQSTGAVAGLAGNAYIEYIII